MARTSLNGFDISKTSHYLYGYIIPDEQHKTFTINGTKNVLRPNKATIKQVQIIYESFKFDYQPLTIEIHYGPQLSLYDPFTTSQPTKKQTFNVNMTIANGYFKSNYATEIKC